MTAAQLFLLDGAHYEEHLHLLSPEHKMLTACLYSSIKDCFRGTREVRRDAVRWFQAYDHASS
jgi:hypothetical protein